MAETYSSSEGMYVMGHVPHRALHVTECFPHTATSRLMPSGCSALGLATCSRPMRVAMLLQPSSHGFSQILAVILVTSFVRSACLTLITLDPVSIGIEQRYDLASTGAAPDRAANPRV